MAVQDEIAALRRLLDSINRQAAAAAQSTGKLASDITVLREELRLTRQTADRAIQMCNDLNARLTALQP